MLKGVNDSLAEASELVRLLAGIPAKINLIPFNPWPGAPYECSDWERIEAFADVVNRAGYASPIRTPRGRDIFAACGQLKSASERMRKSEREASVALTRLARSQLVERSSPRSRSELRQRVPVPRGADAEMLFEQRVRQLRFADAVRIGEVDVLAFDLDLFGSGIDLREARLRAGLRLSRRASSRRRWLGSSFAMAGNGFCARIFFSSAALRRTTAGRKPNSFSIASSIVFASFARFFSFARENDIAAVQKRPDGSETEQFVERLQRRHGDRLVSSDVDTAEKGDKDCHAPASTIPGGENEKASFRGKSIRASDVACARWRFRCSPPEQYPRRRFSRRPRFKRPRRASSRVKSLSGSSPAHRRSRAIRRLAAVDGVYAGTVLLPQGGEVVVARVPVGTEATSADLLAIDTNVLAAQPNIVGCLASATAR